MASITRRQLTALLLASALPAWAQPKSAVGIRVDFVVSESHSDNGVKRERSYQDAVLVADGEPFAMEFHRDFHIFLVPHDRGSSAFIEIAVNDSLYGGQKAGEGSVSVPFGTVITLPLGEVSGRLYQVKLWASRKALPAS